MIKVDQSKSPAIKLNQKSALFLGAKNQIDHQIVCLCLFEMQISPFIELIDYRVPLRNNKNMTYTPHLLLYKWPLRECNKNIQINFSSVILFIFTCGYLD